jgi:RNA recognition motif-containing protein
MSRDYRDSRYHRDAVDHRDTHDSRQSRQEQIARTVYVGSIDRGVAASDIVDFFSVCGPISFVRLDGDAYRGNRSAFIEFLSQSSAQTALKLTGKILFNMQVR